MSALPTAVIPKGVDFEETGDPSRFVGRPAIVSKSTKPPLYTYPSAVW
jgi:hypothetical protein